MPVYGTQIKPMARGATLGYGDFGQVYNTENPVYMTQGGMRPSNAAGVGNNAPASGPYATTPYRIDPRAAMSMASYRPPAWTAQGKALATREQQMYGGDLYGNNAATGGLGGSGAGSGGTGTYQSGITAGFVDPASIARGVATFGMGGQAPGIPVSPAAYNTMQSQYNGLMGQGMNTAALDFARNAAYQSADLNLAQQRARADAGIGYGNLLARIAEMNMGGQNQQDSLAQSLLLGLLG